MPFDRKRTTQIERSESNHPLEHCFAEKPCPHVLITFQLRKEKRIVFDLCRDGSSSSRQKINKMDRLPAPVAVCVGAGSPADVCPTFVTAPALSPHPPLVPAPGERSPSAGRDHAPSGGPGREPFPTPVVTLPSEQASLPPLISNGVSNTLAWHKNCCFIN